MVIKFGIKDSQKDRLRVIHMDPEFKEKRYLTMKANGTLNV